jgi:glycosyltransferase involved in cell wall biosynthesis
MVSARYIPYIGGTEIHTYEVARRLAQAGHDITVLTTDLSRDLPPVEHTQGVQIVRVPAWPAQRDYYFAPEIYRYIRNNRWDLIHCQGYHTFVAPLTMLAARQAGIPYVVSFHSGGHSSSVRNALRGVQQWLLRPLLIQARKLIGVSKFESDYFQKRLGIPHTRFATISNGSYLPRVEKSSQAAIECAKERAGTLIVSIGRLERHKGHHRTIEALPEVAKSYPDVHLRIVGAGPYGETLWQLAAHCGMAQRVAIGPIAASERAGLAQLLATSNLAILLSDYESQGIAVLEALSLGIPALVTHTSGLAQLANDGLVRSVPLNSSTQTVAAAMIQQLHQPLIAPSVALPSWEQCATQLLALYEEVLAEAPAHVGSYEGLPGSL